MGNKIIIDRQEGEELFPLLLYVQTVERVCLLRGRFIDYDIYLDFNGKFSVICWLV